MGRKGNRWGVVKVTLVIRHLYCVNIILRILYCNI